MSPPPPHLLVLAVLPALAACSEGDPHDSAQPSWPVGVMPGAPLRCAAPTEGLDRLREEGVARGLDLELP